MTEGPELDLGLPPRKPTMADLLGRHVTISNPGNDSSWTGRVIAYHDDPGVVIETADGTHICLPQAFGIEEVPAPAAQAGRLARVEVKGFRDLGIVRVTETTLAGEPMLHAECGDGSSADFPASSVHFITWLPEGTALAPAKPQAIPSGWRDDQDDDSYDRDDDDDEEPF